MAKTPSNMVPLGSKAPDFELLDVISGKMVTLKSSNEPKATVIMFICNHCPFVRHLNSELTKIANDYQPKGVRFIAINSNDVTSYPDDSPENMIINAQEHQYPFPYLFDETQSVARAYDAACTPDFFVYDNELELAYRGQLDDSRPGNDIPLTGSDIRDALDCILDNKPLIIQQKPSIGCNIKWK